MHTKNIKTIILVILIASLTKSVYASSHRDAPMISEDPTADATDLYAFVSPDKPDTVTILANYIPIEEATVNSNFKFSDDVLYSILIDNDGDAREDITYNFRFNTKINDKDSLLYSLGPIQSIDDKNFHVRQTYTLSKVERGVTTILGKDLPVPPNNIGPKSLPDYEKISNSAITNLPNGVTTFAGQVDDPFFVDIGSLIDLISIRRLPGTLGGGVDGFGGFNTHTLALQIPINQLIRKDHPVIGIWTTASRQKVKVLNTNATTQNSGEWVQISRLGNPLINDFFIPFSQKDLWNFSKLTDDAQFYDLITNPAVATNISSYYGIKVPLGGAYAQETARGDLFAIIMTGIGGLNVISDREVPSDQLRLNTSIKPAGKIDTMGLLNGDTQGYPNGRRLEDDVVDIYLRAAVGAVYAKLTNDPAFVADKAASYLGDGVDANDKQFRPNFPYVALPISGVDSIPHATLISEFIRIITLPLNFIMNKIL